LGGVLGELVYGEVELLVGEFFVDYIEVLCYCLGCVVVVVGYC